MSTAEHQQVHLGSHDAELDGAPSHGQVSDSMDIAQLCQQSPLWLGSAHYPSPVVLRQALSAAQTGVVTLGLRRIKAEQADSGLVDWLKSQGLNILPNTAGCHTVQEAVLLAQVGRELFDCSWIKLEIIGDDYSLAPHMGRLIEATAILSEQGFAVLPYCTEDLVLCQELVDAGAKALMPWGAPIGTGQGLRNPKGLWELRQRFAHLPMLVDAGLGKPSQAAQAMEMGYDAVLLNTAVAKAHDPVAMAEAFALAVRAGRQAYRSGMMAEREQANASTTLLDRPFWQQA